MSEVNNLKYLVKNWLGSCLSFLLLFYFAFHLTYGDRGYFALRNIDDQITSLQMNYDRLQSNRTSLEHRVSLLRPNNLGLDILDERSREVLGLIGTGEYIIFD